MQLQESCCEILDRAGPVLGVMGFRQHLSGEQHVK